MNDLSTYSATHLLRLINKGNVSSREVVEHFIAKIKETNPAINAVILKLFDDALEQADKADEMLQQGKSLGRLHGLPFTIKECFDLIGTPSSFGLLRRKNDLPDATDPYVNALTKEGAIVLGKTNVSQLLAAIESQNPVYGTSSNFHSSQHTSGGSSGGEGAIIAAGGSPIGLGTDLGGSVRIPAAFNGICSIKPTMRRTIDKSRLLERDLPIPVKSVTGILANHAEDLQLFLDIMDSASKEPNPPLKQFTDVDFSNLKVGYLLSDQLFEPSNAIKETILKSVDKLNKLGVETCLFDPPNLVEAEEMYVHILTTDNMAIFRENLKDDKLIAILRNFFMIEKTSHFTKKILYQLLNFIGQENMARAMKHLLSSKNSNPEKLAVKLQKFIDKFLLAMDTSPIGKLDAIMGPVFPLPGVLHNGSANIGLGGSYTLLHNLTGFPAGVATISKHNNEAKSCRKNSLDLIVRAARKNEKHSHGLPLSVQIASRSWNEHIVIALIDKLHTRL